MEGEESVRGLPAEASKKIEKSVTTIETQNKSFDPGQQLQRGKLNLIFGQVADVMEDIVGPIADGTDIEHPHDSLAEGDLMGSQSIPCSPIQDTHAFSSPGSRSPIRSEANGVAGADDDSATESLPTSSDTEAKNHGKSRSPIVSARTDTKSIKSTKVKQREALEPECLGNSKSVVPSDKKVFLQNLANKFLESKKLAKKESWTMKDVLASGHFAGLEVEFRARIGDPQGSGTFGEILDDGKIRCYCKTCIENPPSIGFTGTRWEEHFGGKSQRPFLHIFFKHIDLSLKEFWIQWCENNGSSGTKPKSSKSKRAAPATPATRRVEGARCFECHGGATQLVCEGCDNLFHLRCLGMLRMPVGNWFCQECVLSGRDTLYSEISLRNRSEKRKLLINASDNEVSTAKRHKPQQSEASGEGQLLSQAPESLQKSIEAAEGCTYVLRDLDYVSGSCALCGSPDYEEVISKDLDPRAIIICDTCECEYHIGCLKSKGMADLKEIPEEDWFCSPKCRRVNSVLLSAVKNGEVWPDKKLSYCVLRGRLTTSENMRRIKKVEQIITSCFDPVVDGVTRENLLPMIVRGQRLSNSWDFSGFHSLLLKVNRVWVAAALFKVYKHTAEVPFVATDPEYRGRGYSRKIMQVLEKIVRKAGIEKMLLPSAEATVNLWKKPQFGFKRASEDYTQGNRFLQFPGTVWLEKLL